MLAHRTNPNPRPASQANLILQATDSKAARSVTVGHCGIAAGEVQATRGRPTNRATPTIATRTDTCERAIIVATVARQGPFERGSKSTYAIILAPT